MNEYTDGGRGRWPPDELRRHRLVKCQPEPGENTSGNSVWVCVWFIVCVSLKKSVELSIWCLFWVWSVLTCGQQCTERLVNSTFHILFPFPQVKLAKVSQRSQSQLGFGCQITSVNSPRFPLHGFAAIPNNSQNLCGGGVMIKLRLIGIKFTGLDWYQVQAGATSGPPQRFEPFWPVSSFSSHWVALGLPPPPPPPQPPPSTEDAPVWLLSRAGQTLIRGRASWQRSPPAEGSGSPARGFMTGDLKTCRTFSHRGPLTHTCTPNIEFRSLGAAEAVKCFLWIFYFIFLWKRNLMIGKTTKLFLEKTFLYNTSWQTLMGQLLFVLRTHISVKIKYHHEKKINIQWSKPFSRGLVILNLRLIRAVWISLPNAELSFNHSKGKKSNIIYLKMWWNLLHTLEIARL